MSNISSDFPTRQPAPIIGENGTWLEWDELTQAYVDTGKPSRGDSAGLSDAVKAALLTIAEKAGYSDTHGRDYYDALYAALYPPAELLTITASFAQGSHTVYDTDTLESLKPYLTVTGAYDDDTRRTITSYTLSGTLAEGTSTITVTASGKTATFTVSVTHKVAQVTGISAVFTQGSAVIYDNASLDDLKPYLVVTASYDDGTSAAVSGYTLSGTLAAGTSTITASYGGFSDTFAVTVTAHPAVLTSITAVFTQGQNVIYTTDSLDTLKQYLVVTAHYDDSTDTVVSNYTLSGTLTVGTSTITVSYGGKSDTFNVTVTEKSLLLFSVENRSITADESGLIKTDVDLISADIDFSICFDATITQRNGAYKLFYHWENASPWRGPTLGRGDASNSNVNAKYISNFESIGKIAGSLSSCKVVMTHVKGSGELKIYCRLNGATSTTTITISETFTSLTPRSGGLCFGYHTAANSWAGTINRAYIRADALTQAQAEAFLTGEQL